MSTFRDVPEEAWFARSVSAIVQAGIASGYRDTEGNLTGLFGPGDPVTYAEMAKMSLALAGKDTSSAPGAPMNPTAFGQWSEGTIRLAEDLGLTVYAAFPDVNAPAPRGAVLQTVLEAMEIPLHSNTISFDDVPPNHPHAFAIASATMLGIVSGDTDAEGNPTGTFRPDDPINRAEVAKVLVRVGGMHCPP